MSWHFFHVVSTWKSIYKPKPKHEDKKEQKHQQRNQKKKKATLFSFFFFLSHSFSLNLSHASIQETKTPLQPPGCATQAPGRMTWWGELLRSLVRWALSLDSLSFFDLIILFLFIYWVFRLVQTWDLEFF